MWKFVKEFFLFLLDIAIFTLAVSVLAVPWALLTLYKSTLIPIAKYFYGLELIPFDGMSGLDQLEICVDKQHLISSSKNSDRNVTLASNIALSIKYEGPQVELRQLRDLISEKLLHNNNNNTFANLSVHFVKFGGHIFKQKLAVDLNSHVREVELERGDYVENLYAKWVARPYDKERPLWEVLSISKPQRPIIGSDVDEPREPVCYLALKMHHGLGDGQTAAYILQTLFGTTVAMEFERDPKASAPELPIRSRIKDSAVGKLLQKIRTPRALFTFNHKITWISQKMTLRPNDVYDFDQYLAFGTLPLDKIKELRKKVDVNFQCILHTLLAESLVQIYKQRGHVVPQSVFQFGTLPVPNHPYKERMCNWAAGLWLHVDLAQMSPLERLLAINKNYTEFYKAGLHQTVTSTLGQIEALIPVLATQAKAGSPCQASWSALVMENHTCILGRKIVSIHPMGGLGWFGMSLTGFSVSHSNQLDFTFHGNRQLFPKREQLVQVVRNIEMEFGRLYKACYRDKPSFACQDEGVDGNFNVLIV